MEETKTEFCLSCGNKIGSDDRFCNNCGTPIKDIELDEQPIKEQAEPKIVASTDLVIQKTDADSQPKIVKTEKKVLGRNAIILTAFATSFFVVPCFYVNLIGYPFALAAIIVGIVSLTKRQQKVLAIVSICLSAVFIIFSILARAVFDMGYI